MSTEPFLLFNSSVHGCQMSVSGPANLSEALWDSLVVSQGVLRQLHSSRKPAIINNGGEKEDDSLAAKLRKLYLIGGDCTGAERSSRSLLLQTIEFLYLSSAWEGVEWLNIATYGLNVRPHQEQI